MEKQLQDTLAKLRVKADFKPLPKEEAYAFINKYYLPRLDTTPIHRRIFVHPLSGINFQKIFENDSILLVEKYLKDSVKTQTSDNKLHPPPSGLYNNNYNWDEQRFVNTSLASDSLQKQLSKHRGNGYLNNLKAFRKQFGDGYMIISYPLYNAHTNKLIINEWLEDAGWCGTGKDRKYLFKKIPGGWEEIR